MKLSQFSRQLPPTDTATSWGKSVRFLDAFGILYRAHLFHTFCLQHYSLTMFDLYINMSAVQIIPVHIQEKNIVCVSYRSVVVPVKKTSPGSLAVHTVGSSSSTSAGLTAGSTPSIFAAATPKSMINTTGRSQTTLVRTLKYNFQLLKCASIKTNLTSITARVLNLTNYFCILHFFFPSMMSFQEQKQSFFCQVDHVIVCVPFVGDRSYHQMALFTLLSEFTVTDVQTSPG